MDTNTAEAELAKERHRNLDIWKNAVALTSRIYELTRTFPKDEIFGLTNQLRRASVSVASNIAEGSKRPVDDENALVRLLSEDVDRDLRTARFAETVDRECFREEPPGVAVASVYHIRYDIARGYFDFFEKVSEWQKGERFRVGNRHGG